MGFIRTMLGDIQPEELGVTDAHEHIVCRPGHWVDRREDDLLLDDPEKSKGDVLLFKAAGGEAIVDATAVDYGRDLLAVKKIAEETGIKIIATAGFNKSFLWDALLPGSQITYHTWIEQARIEELTQFVVKEFSEGMEGTEVRAGQLKFGTGYNMIDPLEEKTLRAVVRAHHITGAPVHSHTEAGTMALEQIELLKQEGMDMRHVSIGHMDRNPDTWYHLKIAESGAFLSFDGIGKIKYYPESVRIQCLLELVKRGYQKQILIGGDAARKTYYQSYLHGLGLGYILGKWVPRFIEEAEAAGFNGQELVDDFFRNNPRRYLTIE